MRKLSIWIQKSDLVYILKPFGREVIPCRFDEIKFFQDDRMGGQNSDEYFQADIGDWQKGKWGILDRRENWIIEPIFEDIDYVLSKDRCFAFYAADRWSSDDVPMGIYSIFEKRDFFEPQFSDVTFCDNNLLLVESYDEKLHRTIEQIINHNGNLIFD